MTQHSWSPGIQKYEKSAIQLYISMLKPKAYEYEKAKQRDE